MQKSGKKLRESREYSEDFKRQLVSEYERGESTVRELSRHYQIAFQVIYRWIKRYLVYQQQGYVLVEKSQSKLEDFYYAVLLIDIYTKRIVGFKVSDNMYAEANLAALKQALRLRHGEPLNGLVHHSDRGSQYGAKLYPDVLKKRGIGIRMGLHAQGNAYVERVNGTIKNEYLAHRSITSFSQLKREVAKAVKPYNEKRIHNGLPGKTKPVAFEQELCLHPAQARPLVEVHAYARPDYSLVKTRKLSCLIPTEKNVVSGLCPLMNHPCFFTQNGQC